MKQRLYDSFFKGLAGILFLLLMAFFLAALFVKAVYRYDDSPAFVSAEWYDWAAIILLGLFLFLMCRYRKSLDRWIPKQVSISLFFVISLLFAVLVPLKPFSDMKQLYDGALAVSRGEFSFFRTTDYFQMYPNNLFACVIYGALLAVFPDSVMTLKICNICVAQGIVFLTRKLLDYLFGQVYENLFYFCSLFFLPIILYVNHIYTDQLFVLGSLLIVYLYLRQPGGTWIFLPVLLAGAYLLRPQSAFYGIAFLILFLFGNRQEIKEKLLPVLGGLLIFILVVAGFFRGIVPKLVGTDAKSMPVWSYIYMGLNEEEFGFQDNSHSMTRSPEDVKERIASYTPVQLGKILVKKTDWMWTEGTYQASRYAFGDDGMQPLEKFEYETWLTRRTKDSADRLRIVADAFMRGQYLLLLLITAYGIFRIFFVRKGKPPEIAHVGLLLFYANLFFYLIWEIKSRYLLPLYPFLLLFGLGNLFKKERE